MQQSHLMASVCVFVRARAQVILISVISNGLSSFQASASYTSLIGVWYTTLVYKQTIIRAVLMC